MSHRQTSDTCRKPGIAFTMEYHIPGRDIRTLVVQAQCRNAAFIAISGVEPRTMACALERPFSAS
eukprot:3709333-Amphidinium_carterae.1